MVKEIDLGKELGKVVATLKDEYEEFEKVSGDVWNVLIDKAEAEAYDKIKMVPKGQEVVAYGVLYRWFTDVSGLGLAEQARMLMAPTAPKREEDLAEHVEMWQDKMRRLEAHGEEFRLAPVFKISALRTLMIGKSMEYFDLWESDKDHTDPSKSYEELLAKVKDYSRRKKLDNTAREKIQHGGEPMDVGAVGGWSWNDDTGGGYDQGEGIYAFAFKGKGKGKGKGECYNCGASGHYARDCPNPQKGKSKGKGFQRECYNCGEKGHPAR